MSAPPYEHPKAYCPRCGKFVDRCTGVRDDSGPPKPGDFTICIDCATCLRFGPELQLAEATEQDLKVLDGPGLLEIIRAQNAVLQLAARRGGR